MISFWHKLMNPHCPDCIREKECKNCDVLNLLLDQERHTNKQLLNTIIELTKPVQVVETKERTEQKPLQSYIPWKVKQQILEQEDRALAKVIAENKLNQIKPMTVEELENKLGIEDAPRISEEAS